MTGERIEFGKRIARAWNSWPVVIIRLLVVLAVLVLFFERFPFFWTPF